MTDQLSVVIQVQLRLLQGNRFVRVLGQAEHVLDKGVLDASSAEFRAWINTLTGGAIIPDDQQLMFVSPAHEWFKKGWPGDCPIIVPKVSQSEIH